MKTLAFCTAVLALAFGPAAQSAEVSKPGNVVRRTAARIRRDVILGGPTRPGKTPDYQ